MIIDLKGHFKGMLKDLFSDISQVVSGSAADDPRVRVVRLSNNTYAAGCVTPEEIDAVAGIFKKAGCTTETAKRGNGEKMVVRKPQQQEAAPV